MRSLASSLAGILAGNQGPWPSFVSGVKPACTLVNTYMHRNKYAASGQMHRS